MAGAGAGRSYKREQRRSLDELIAERLGDEAYTVAPEIVTAVKRMEAILAARRPR